jgi:hypothetical protein
LAGDVEPFGILVSVGIAIGGGRVDDEARARAEQDSVEDHIFDPNADGGKGRQRVAHDLLDGLWSKFGMLCQQGPLIGVIDKDLNRSCQLVARGVGAREEKDSDEVEDFAAGEPVAIVLCADELRDQVVGECSAAALDQVVEVGVELLPRGQDCRCVGGGVGSKGLADASQAVGEQLPVPAGYTKCRADDRNGIRPGDVDDDITAALVNVAV